jgi:hypothetical protein
MATPSVTTNPPNGKPAFTPGPWRVREGGNQSNIIAVATIQACELENYAAQEDSIKANMALIASAPSLYAALEEAEKALQAVYNEDKTQNGWFRQHVTKQLVGIRQALSLARGESTEASDD